MFWFLKFKKRERLHNFHLLFSYVFIFLTHNKVETWNYNKVIWKNEVLRFYSFDSWFNYHRCFEYHNRSARFDACCYGVFKIALVDNRRKLLNIYVCCHHLITILLALWCDPKKSLFCSGLADIWHHRIFGKVFITSKETAI